MPRWLDTGRAARLRSAELDRRAALWLHGVAARPLPLALLVVCSRVADGPLWVALILALPWIDATHGAARAPWLLLLGTVNLLLYVTLKRSTRRMRPFERCDGIRACARVPDAFSFPSGHTLHAVAFALAFSAYYPWTALVLWPLAAVVAMSRVVLGLHYPSDVLVGALVGAGTAALVMLT